MVTLMLSTDVLDLWEMSVSIPKAESGAGHGRMWVSVKTMSRIVLWEIQW